EPRLGQDLTRLRRRCGHLDHSDCVSRLPGGGGGEERHGERSHDEQGHRLGDSRADPHPHPPCVRGTEDERASEVDEQAPRGDAKVRVPAWFSFTGLFPDGYSDVGYRWAPCRPPRRSVVAVSSVRRVDPPVALRPRDRGRAPGDALSARVAEDPRLDGYAVMDRVRGRAAVLPRDNGQQSGGRLSAGPWE